MSKSKRRRRRSRDTGFYAYSSHYPLQGEVIESAIRQINESPDAGLFVTGWKDTPKESSRIITNILSQIDEVDFFLADLSDLNHNVLFELGYAVSRKKPVVLSIQGNSDAERQRAMGDLHILSTWDVTKVQNAGQLVEAIRKFAPGRQPELETYSGTDEEPGCCLFLKGETNQEIAVTCLETALRKGLRVLLDDWSEDPVQSFTWYYRAVCQSAVVLALFVDPTWDLAQGSNARFAFVCGLAHGLGKGLAMVGLPGYQPVVDYGDLMWKVESAVSATRMVEQTFRDLEKRPRARQTARGTPKAVARELVLLDFLSRDIGETLAENEEAELGDLFIDTPQFWELLRGRKTLFVGSKGAGKTANFFQARERLALDRSCVVCCVKPIDYKMARLISALRELSDHHAAAVHIAENAWKLVAVSELVEATYRAIVVRPVWVQPTPAERDLIRFWERNRELITAALQSKLDIAVDWLEQASFNQDNYSQLVHDRFISPANRLLRPLLSGKTCHIMFDNLDKAWDKSQDLRAQARLLFALLGVGRRIQDDLGREATIRIAVFLRRNIVQYHLLDEGREPDKLLAQTSELNWDPDSLVGLIERRVQVVCTRHGLESINPWESLFVPQVNGIETKRWIVQNIIPRPRDLISLVKGAFEQAAMNHDSLVVEEQDLLRAQEQYSMFALGQMIGEYRSENPWLEDIVSSLAGQNSRITLRELESSIEQTLGHRCDAGPESDVRSIVACLVDMGFIGIRFSDEDIRYATTIPDGRVLCQKVRKHPSRVPLHLEVHPVYHRCLSLRPGAAVRPKSAFERVLSRFGVLRVRSS